MKFYKKRKKEIMKKTLNVSLFLFALLFASCSGSVTGQSSAANGVVRLQNKQVCMVNDRFMNKDQMPVPVNNKTYYGCCAGCVTTLQNDSNSRYGLDMTTNEKVNKATAFIIKKPNTEDGVLYFASEANAIKYMQGMKSKH